MSDSETQWNIVRQAPQSMEFSRQEYWIGFPFPPPGDLPEPGIQLESLMAPALVAGFSTTEPPGKPHNAGYLLLTSVGEVAVICVQTTFWEVSTPPEPNSIMLSLQREQCCCPSLKPGPAELSALNILIRFPQVSCFLGDSVVKNLSGAQETWVQSLGWEDLIKKEVATHCSILAWEKPMDREPGGLQSMVFQKVRFDLVTTRTKSVALMNPFNFPFLAALTRASNSLPLVLSIFSILFISLFLIFGFDSLPSFLYLLSHFYSYFSFFFPQLMHYTGFSGDHLKHEILLSWQRINCRTEENSAVSSRSLVYKFAVPLKFSSAKAGAGSTSQCAVSITAPCSWQVVETCLFKTIWIKLTLFSWR